MMPSKQTGYLAVVGLLLLGFCGACAYMLAELRRESRAEAVASSSNLLTVLSQDIRNDVRAYERVLERLARMPSSIVGTASALSGDQAFDDLTVEPFIGSVSVFAPNGHTVARLRPGRSPDDDPRFGAFVTEQIATPPRDLTFSAPFGQGSLGQRAYVAVARAAFGRDGEPMGVAVGTLNLAYFQQLLSQTQMQAGDSVNLFSDDGILLMRNPLPGGEIGRDLSGSATVQRFLSAQSGMFSASATLDGTHRFYNFNHIRELPLILNVGLATANIYSAWRHQVFVVSVLLVILCAVAIALGLMIRTEFKKRAQAEQETRRSEAQYRLLADHATDLILHLDRDLTRLFVSPASRPMLGYAPDEMKGRKTREIVHPEDWPLVQSVSDRARATGGSADAVYRLQHRDGHYVWVEGRYSHVGADDGFIVVLRDITKRKQAELKLEAAHAELAQLASTDGLTGLANRRRFDEVLTRLLEEAARDAAPLSLLLIDVDRFKAYNDTYGHLAGDACLRRVSRAIESGLRPGDLCARYGGEEIAVLLPGVSAQTAAQVGERTRRAVEELAIEHRAHAAGGHVTISVGCATMAPPLAPDAQIALVDQADRFLYEAKRTGRNQVISSSNLPSAPSAPVPPREEARLAAVQAMLERAKTKDPASFNLIAEQAATLMDVPIGLVSLVGEHELNFIGRHGTNFETVARDISFCAHTITGSEPMVVRNASEDARFRNNPLVTNEAPLRFYAGVPMLDPASGEPVGSVCVFDLQPHGPLSDAQREILKNLSVLAAKEIG